MSLSPIEKERITAAIAEKMRGPIPPLPAAFIQIARQSLKKNGAAAATATPMTTKAA